jgi:signal transduction histidine kinase
MVMSGLAVLLVLLALAVAGLAMLAARQRTRLGLAEARARAAEERFDLVSVSAGSWLWETDAEMRLGYLSRLPSGGNPDEVLGKRRDEFSGIESDSAEWQRHREDLAARRPFDNFVFTRDVPRIGRRTMRIQGHPIFDARSRFVGYRGTGTDVTGEFAAKAEAERADRRLLDAVNALTSGFALFTPDDRLAVCNRRFVEIYAPIASVIEPGRHFDEIVRRGLEVDLFKGAIGRAEAWRAERLAYHRDPTASFEMELSDGRYLLVGDHPTSDGCRVVIHTDITELKAREGALAQQSDVLSTTINSIAEALSVFDSDLKLSIWNEPYQRLFDFPAALMKVGTPFEAFLRFNAERGEFDPCDRETEIAIRLAQVTNRQSFQRDHVRPDGTVIEVRRRHPAGGGMLTTFADITERKRFENALQTAKEQAELASRAKTAFLANMSHELRTPLNAIIGFAEIIREQLLGPVGTEKYLDYVGDIHLSGNHLLEVINDILDLSKIESGKFELLEKPIDLERVLASTLRLLGDKAAKSNLTVRSRLPDPRPLLYADERAMKQILLNLLSNSVKFTPPGGLIEVMVELAPDGDLLLVVADTGIGFDLADLPRALAPFGQVDASLTRRYQGTGLGLPLVNSLTQLHGGRLEIDSKPEHGTRVVVRLPASRVIAVGMTERAALAAEPS